MQRLFIQAKGKWIALVSLSFLFAVQHLFFAPSLDAMLVYFFGFLSGVLVLHFSY